MCSWLKCLQYVADNPYDVLSKLHKEADVSEFRERPTFNSYITDCQRLYRESSKTTIVTDTPRKSEKSLADLLAEEKRQLVRKATLSGGPSPKRKLLVDEEEEESSDDEEPIVEKKKKKKRKSKHE